MPIFTLFILTVAILSLVWYFCIPLFHRIGNKIEKESNRFKKEGGSEEDEE